MTDRVAGKKIASAALHALKEALSLAYWYKSDLRSFLTQALADTTILGRLNWQDYKRNIVSQLVDFLSRNEDVYQRQLLRLMAKDRMECTGMRWRVEGAQAMLNVRATYINGDWQPFFEYRIEANARRCAVQLDILHEAELIEKRKVA